MLFVFFFQAEAGIRDYRVTGVQPCALPIFEDKLFLITGGSRGLGLAMAREFARHGARLALCARDPDELRRAPEDLAAQGSTVEDFTGDLMRKEDVQRLIADVREHLGPIDVMVNNAGRIE